MIRAVVVMGVSGSGKTTLGLALAERLGWHYVEADDQHPPENIAKMAAGIPLTDDDRIPFLTNVANAMAALKDEGVIATCSALKRSYRDLIRDRVGAVAFLMQVLTPEALRARMKHREGHFMPASLLDSQLASLELPGDDENAIFVDGDAPVDAQVAEAISALKRLATIA
ncbi:gluconokinase [Sphingomonas sp. MMS24-J13]|uniref:gluconokinase n=1 Tax=Sphingomonas sp. MMS24-J13 TaxID=3238686 RepID=UPI00384AC850